MTISARIHISAFALVLAAMPLAAQANIEPSHAGQAAQSSAGQGSAGTPSAGTPGAGTPSFTNEQLLTATVHQAWLLSGKNEEVFFGMVQQLAEISAKNREITLPESEAAGRRMGNYIKQSARADTDQLLFAVVDKAVVMVAHLPAHPARGNAAAGKPAAN